MPHGWDFTEWETGAEKLFWNQAPAGHPHVDLLKPQENDTRKAA